MLQQAFDGKGSEFEFSVPNGSGLKTFSSSFIPVILEQGKVTHIVGITQDISEQTTAKQKLKESEEMFSKAFYDQPLPMQIFNINTGQRIDANTSYLEFFGITKEEFKQQNFLTQSHWIDSQKLKESRERLIRDGVITNLVVDVYTNSGAVKTVVGNGAMLETGKGEWAITSFMDITESKKTQQAKNLSDRRLALLMNTLPFGAFISKQRFLRALRTR